LPCHRASPSFPTRRSSDLAVCFSLGRFVFCFRKFLFSARHGTFVRRRSFGRPRGSRLNRAPLLCRSTCCSRTSHICAQDFYLVVDRKSTRLNSSHVSISYA